MYCESFTQKKAFLASIYEILNLPQLPLGQFVFHKVGAPVHVLGSVVAEQKAITHLLHLLGSRECGSRGLNGVSGKLLTRKILLSTVTENIEQV